MPAALPVEAARIAALAADMTGAAMAVEMKDLQELRSLRHPPQEVRHVAEAAAAVMGLPEMGWPALRRRLDGSFLQRLAAINTAAMVRCPRVRAERFIRMLDAPAFTDASLPQKCPAAVTLAKWCLTVGRLIGRLHGSEPPDAEATGNSSSPYDVPPACAQAATIGLAPLLAAVLELDIPGGPENFVSTTCLGMSLATASTLVVIPGEPDVFLHDGGHDCGCTVPLPATEGVRLGHLVLNSRGGGDAPVPDALQVSAALEAVPAPVANEAPEAPQPALAAPDAPEEAPDLGGLFVEPRLWRLEEWELAVVRDLRIGRDGVGHVTIHGITDCRGLLAVLREIFIVERGEVIVYPDVRQKPPVGHGLNKPSSIVLYGCMPKAQARLPHPAARERYRQRVAQMTVEKGAIFEDYDCDDGIWKFRVDHF